MNTQISNIKMKYSHVNSMVNFIQNKILFS